MGNYDLERGFLRGISDEEFEILFYLTFKLGGYKIGKIRRGSMFENDLLASLSRVQKGFLGGEKTFHFVLYVDRNGHELSNKWMEDFWSRANSHEIPLYSQYDRTIKKILIFSISKINKKEIKDELKRNVQFCDGNKFFEKSMADHWLKEKSHENFSLISDMYSVESNAWDKMPEEEKKEFCAKNRIDYEKHRRLWKYPIGQQSMMIVALRHGMGQEKRGESRKSQQGREESDRTHNSELKKFYDALGLSETATSSEIKNEYRKWIKFFHPDKFENKSPEDKEKALEKSKKMTVAYEELKKAGKVD